MNYPRRKNSLRRPGWDYRNGGCYFITFCTYKRICYFEFGVNEISQKIESIVARLPTFKGSWKLEVIEWVLMPNHIHLLLYLDSGFEHDPAPQPNNAHLSIGAITGTLKRRISKEIKPLLPAGIEHIWQRGYYDRIVRNEREFLAIQEYIRRNPERWLEDRNNIDGVLQRMEYHR
ncbi:MAG: transposase [Chloroflexota bacterium]